MILPATSGHGLTFWRRDAGSRGSAAGAHAVSRTVIVISPISPQQATRKHPADAPGPGRELQGNEATKASPHGGVVQALRIDFPHASVRVASVVAVNILAAGIVQVKWSWPMG